MTHLGHKMTESSDELTILKMSDLLQKPKYIQFIVI